MSKPHKDLPGGSQAWAAEVDALMTEVKELREVVKRLSANAGIDFSNPGRGINTGDTPSVQNPVGQKLSSLADVGTYNVADGQYLSWSQQGQKWLPVTLPSAGGTVDISEVSYSALQQGYGVVTDVNQYAYVAAEMKDNAFGPDFYNVETWATGVQYIGAGNWNDGPVSLIELAHDGFGRPYITLSAEDYADGSSSYLTVFSYGVRFNTPRIILPRCTTATRPADLGTATNDVASMVYDDDLDIPIIWNGTAWTNLIGTAV